jgi:hypothetical protein
VVVVVVVVLAGAADVEVSDCSASLQAATTTTTAKIIATCRTRECLVIVRCNVRRLRSIPKTDCRPQCERTLEPLLHCVDEHATSINSWHILVAKPVASESDAIWDPRAASSH